MALNLQPVTYREACAFIDAHHRHHLPPQGWKFGIAVNDGETVVGVVTVGRPVSRHVDDGWTAEVTRCCCLPGHRNAASMLYGAARRAAWAMGYRRLVTYTLASEAGMSLRAAGYREVGRCRGGSWNVPSRPRVQRAPTCAKTLWEG